MGVHNPTLIHIPAGIYHGWICLGTKEAIVVNVPTEQYNYKNPDEQRLDPHSGEIPYEWERKDG